MSSAAIVIGALTHFLQVDSSTTTLWTSLGCVISFYYYYVL